MRMTFRKKLKEFLVYFTVGHHLMLLLLSSSIDAFELGLNEPIHIKEILEPRLCEDREQ